MDESIDNSITDSEFTMWRAVFAFSLTGNTMSAEEQKFLKPHVHTVPFTKDHIETLKGDFKNPRNVEDLYAKIRDTKDKERFCVLARALAWCGGSMGKKEEEILKNIACLPDDAAVNAPNRTHSSHPNVISYYRNYARASTTDILRPQTLVEIRA